MPFELGVTFVTLSVGGFVWGGADEPVEGRSSDLENEKGTSVD
jgi:hypothetical protein